MGNIKIPEWIEEGPMDLEYKTYRMMSRIKELERTLASGLLMDVLWEVDDTLDYLYRYDAQQLTRTQPNEYEVMGLHWEDLEMVFSTQEELQTNEVLDTLVNNAIDKFEHLHSLCRDIWRDIESNITYGYIGSKKYFLSDGFVFIKTPDNKLHIYYFNKPTKHYQMSWRDFKMQHIKTEDWDNSTYIARLQEIEEKKSDKILIRVESANHTKIENHALAVINYSIFTLLHRDYSF